MRIPGEDHPQTNASIRRSMSARGLHLGLAEAADRVAERLLVSGPAALDVAIEQHRARAVGVSIEYGLEQLPASSRDRFLELGIFAPGGPVPLAALQLLWGRTGGLKAPQAAALCDELADLSLLRLQGTGSGPGVRLHDAIRDYARATLGSAGRQRAHRALLKAGQVLVSRGRSAAARSVPWWDLPDEHSYLRRNLAYHLSESGLRTELNRAPGNSSSRTWTSRRPPPSTGTSITYAISSILAGDLPTMQPSYQETSIPDHDSYGAAQALPRRASWRPSSQVSPGGSA